MSEICFVSCAVMILLCTGFSTQPLQCVEGGRVRIKKKSGGSSIAPPPRFMEKSYYIDWGREYVPIYSVNVS